MNKTPDNTQFLQVSKEDSPIITHLINTCADDPARPTLNYISFEDEFIAAADGFRLSVVDAIPSFDGLHGLHKVTKPATKDKISKVTADDDNLHFPDIKSICPTSKPEWSVYADPDYLADLLLGFASAGCECIKISQPNKLGPIVIQGQSKDGHGMYSLLMPMETRDDFKYYSPVETKTK